MYASTQSLTSTTPLSLSKISKLLLGLLALSLTLMGLSTYLSGVHKSIEFTAGVYGFNTVFTLPVLTQVAALSFGVAACVAIFAMFQPRVKSGLGMLLIVMSLIPLGTLMTSNVWIESLGGFPAIGSGQGIIKYFALLAIGFYLLVGRSVSQRILVWLNFAPVALVYIWIGGMKFTLIEAQGIEPLVASSPFLSWMYSLFDLQMTSNLIGVYDLLITVILGLCLWFNRFIVPALLLASTVFLVTQSFLISWDSALSATTVLTSGGQFVIKDIWYIVNLLIIYVLTAKNH